MHEAIITSFKSNAEFLHAIFGEQYPFSHVTSFTQDPSNIPSGESGRCWAGGYYKDTPLIADSNQFYTVSLFTPDDSGKANRRKANFKACYVIALDDVKEKLPIDQVMRLPAPSIKLKSSLHSEQWLYLLASPECDAHKIDNLHDGLITNGLAPDGKDPGQKGVTRFLRLPEGVNTKSKRITENGGTAPRCEVIEWRPDRRYNLEQLAEPFGVDLDASRAGKRVDGAAAMPDHPLLHTEGLHVKRVHSNGRYEVRCPWVDEHTGGADNGAAIFTNKDASIGFKCHHGACESRTGGDLLQVIESLDPGFGERLKQWQVMRSFGDVAEPTSATGETLITAPSSPLEALLNKCANGESFNMKKQMIHDKFILKDIAILGQWTVFYAGPNTGKTLLTLWMLQEAIGNGEIDGGKVFYANCDDTYKGGVEKLEIAEQFGFKMLIPNVMDFKSDTLLNTMEAMAEQGEARGVVIVLDTLKKFTDLMDKRISSRFGVIARAFVSAGGSLICLGHVNKHKDGDGKSIYTGTADIRDDADCVYTIEHVGAEEGFCQTTHTVAFECSKSRGAVADKAVFQYIKKKAGIYKDLFNSVRRASRSDAEVAQQAAAEAERRQEDAEIIEKIKTALVNGESAKGTIVKFVCSVSDFSNSKVRTILERYEGRFWSME
ncbi:hypothetical protein [Spongiibacter marinus]|uniref:hypothetical protein n=1 Tax=Spongiibacter marinus TaxID=354246 RepID=UPI0003F8622C|nr:hypothetical protein [Spongiibacter marinus]